MRVSIRPNREKWSRIQAYAGEGEYGTINKIMDEMIDLFIENHDIKEIKSKKCFVYIVKLTHEETNESIYKVGHTTNLEQRMKGIPNAYNKELIQIVEKDSISEAIKLEESIKKRVQLSIQVPVPFGGDSECFKI